MVKYLFPLITLPYLTRVLEPEGYAVYAYVLAFMGFARVFMDFGFNLSGTKKIAAAKEKEAENRVIGAITEARLLLSAISFVVVLAISWFLPITHANMLYTALAFVGICGQALAPDFLFQGHEHMSPITTRYFVSKGISTALTFVCVKSIDDLLWIPVLDILASFVALVWSFVAARRVFGTGLKIVGIGEVLSELKISALYCVSNMSSMIFTGFTTLLIGVVVADQAQVSYWSLTMTAVSAVQSLYSPISNSLYPHMVVNGDFRFARRILLFALAPVLVGTILFSCLADPIMLLVGGKEYLQGANVLKMVSPVLFFSFYGILFGWPILGAAGKVAEITASTFASAAFCIAALMAATFVDVATMPVICGIRCATEALMCCLRGWHCRKILRGI